MKMLSHIKKHLIVIAISFIFAILISKHVESFSAYPVKVLYFTLVNKKIDPIELDDNGIPYVDLGEIGRQRNPVTISHKMLDYYQDYKETQDETARQFLINNAEWLVDNAVTYGNYSILEYDFPWQVYNMTPKWRSAMAQGQAVQALTKAHEITGDREYIDSAQMLLNSFFLEVKDGGVTYKTTAGWWYEEYADVGGKEPRVLNGMMLTLLGIHEYYQYTGNNNAKHLFDQGILALKNDLPLYDDNGYSYYDILGTPAWEYHNVHIELSDQLYSITKEKTFKEYHDKWQNFKEPYSIIQQMQHPTSIIFVAFIVNFVVSILSLEIAILALHIRKKSNKNTFHAIK
jgi:heparosan-N-sulfate-glucuronate 5-epimerase